MPALPTVVTDYLTAVKDSLKQGSDLGSNVRGAAQNYLRAQDMATVLDLLQDGLDQDSSLTATDGTTTTVVDGAGTFVEDQQIGNYVIFEGNITSEIAGEERRITDNDETTLFWDRGDPLPASVQADDNYTIRGGIFDEAVSHLREGKDAADATVNVYGNVPVPMDALSRGIQQISGSPVNYREVWDGDTGNDSTDTEVQLDLQGGSLVPDQLRGYRINITGFEYRTIVRNTAEGLCTLNTPLSSAPSSGTSVRVTAADDNVGGTSAPKIRTHPGAQPGENAQLADLIQQLEDAVVDYTLPT